MDIIVLTSGGVDSSLTCKLLQDSGDHVLPLFINYGQLSYRNELKSCKYICKRLKLPEPVEVDLKGYGKLILSGLTNKSKNASDSAFVPGRNMLFLSIAASYAYTKSVTTIAIGLINGDRFPDQTQEFVVNANFALNSALGKDLTIITPLIKFNKIEVIALAKKHNIPLDKTYSCYKGRNKYCGKCFTCKELLNSGYAKEFVQFKEGN
jgi:7-cyano-7-deazaguanine synthase